MLGKIFTTVKYLLVTVNFLFLITGIIVISVGSSVQSAYNDYHPFLVQRFFSLPAFLIATGIIIFLISFFGFYGAFMENYYMNMIYVGAMLLIFVFQLSVCIAGYALRDNAVGIVKDSMLETIPLYGPNNLEVSKIWDEVQQDFQCCGVDGFDDWLQTPPPQETTEPRGLPVSCCPYIHGSVSEMTCNTGSQFFPKGCGEAFGEWVQAHATGIGIAGIFLVLMQAVAVGGAIWIARMSRAERT